MPQVVDLTIDSDSDQEINRALKRAKSTPTVDDQVNEEEQRRKIMAFAAAKRQDACGEPQAVSHNTASDEAPTMSRPEGGNGMLAELHAERIRRRGPPPSDAVKHTGSTSGTPSTATMGDVQQQHEQRNLTLLQWNVW